MCDTVWDMLWVSGDEGGDEYLRYCGRKSRGGGKGGGGRWDMLISAVDAWTCSMDLIA